MSARGAGISVCIPLYNGERYLAAAIESVLRQTPAPSEILVCDNASTDRSVEVAGRFGNMVRVVEFQEAVGMGANWNRAVCECRSDWVKLLPCDDLLTEGAIARETEAINRHPEAVLISSGKHLMTGSGRPFFPLQPLRPGVYSEADLRERILWSPGNLIGEPGSVTFRRSAWDRAGRFDDRLKYYCDIDLWVRALAEGPCVVLPRPSAYYRAHGGSLTSRQRDILLDDYLLFRSKYLNEPGLQGWHRTHARISVLLRAWLIRLLDRL